MLANSQGAEQAARFDDVFVFFEAIFSIAVEELLQILEHSWNQMDGEGLPEEVHLLGFYFPID